MKLNYVCGFVFCLLMQSFLANTYAASEALLLERLQIVEMQLSEHLKLKEEVKQLKAELDQLKNRDIEISDDLDLVRDDLDESVSEIDESVKSVLGDLTIGGYVDMEFHHRHSKGVNIPSKFDQHRLVFDLQARLSNKISFVAELEYEHAADSVGLEQGYIDYTFEEDFGFRAGSLLVPMGRVNYLHDAPLQELNERPLVSRMLIPTTWFDVGAGIYGKFGEGSSAISYEMYLMNGLQDDGNNLASGQGFRNIRKKGRNKTEGNNNKAISARFAFSPVDNFNLGLAYYKADVGSYSPADDPVLGGERYLDMWGFDIERIINDRLDFQGEFVQGSVDSNLASNIAGTQFLPNNAAYDYSGWYAQFNYLLGHNSKYKAIFRWGKTDASKGFQNSGDRDERVLGINYRPNDSTVYKIEYHWEDEMSNTVQGQALDNDGFVLGVATYF